MARACLKTGWQVHAYCLMSNHWHAVVETPQPNLAAGMRWLLGTYTQSFNRRHRQWGHLFGGRYKAQLIDERSAGYLAQACNYVHLNPKRAGLVGLDKPLQSYRWSSYPAYLKASLRREWLRTDRLLGEHGCKKITQPVGVSFRGAWKGFVRWTWRENISRCGAGGSWEQKIFGTVSDQPKDEPKTAERARDRVEVDQVLAQRLAAECLRAVGWSMRDLAEQPKGDPVKVEIARQLRTQTPMSRAWIARHLHMAAQVTSLSFSLI